jgi:hypothetical protein
LAAETPIILFSEMFKFPESIFVKEETFAKENREFF